MCETCKPPVASLRAPNRHPSFYPQSQRAPRSDAKLAVRRIRQNSTECNRIRQNATKTRARTRARQRRSVSILRGDSRDVRDMQRAGGAVWAHRPEETAAMCETCKPPVASLRALNSHPSFHFQSRRAPRSDAKLAVRRIRRNPTESDRIRQDATKTRARTRARQRRSVFPLPRHGLRPGCSGFNVSHRSELAATLPSCQ